MGPLVRIVCVVLLLVVGGGGTYLLNSDRLAAGDTPEVTAEKAAEAMETYANLVDRARAGVWTLGVSNELGNIPAGARAEAYRKLPLEQRKSIEKSTARRLKAAAWRYADACAYERRKYGTGAVLPDNWIDDFDVADRF